jgi:hypothetical protein
MPRRGLVLLLACLISCGAPTQVEPSTGRGQGGEWVLIRADDLAGHGGVVVTFGDIPGRAVVIESDRLLRVNTPTVPVELRGQPLAITLHFADGERRELNETYVFEPNPVQVRPRD